MGYTATDYNYSMTLWSGADYDILLRAALKLSRDGRVVVVKGSNQHALLKYYKGIPPIRLIYRLTLIS